MDEMKLGELPELDNLQNAETDQMKEWKLSETQHSPKPMTRSGCFREKPLVFVNQ